MHTAHILLILCSAMTSSICGAEEGLMQLCGSDLSDMIDNVCMMTSGMFKRSGVLNYLHRDVYRQATKRTVVDECCHSQCSMETLQSYCGGMDGMMADGPMQRPTLSVTVSPTPKTDPELEMFNTNDMWSKLFDHSSNRLRHGSQDYQKSARNRPAQPRRQPSRRPRYFFVRSITTRSNPTSRYK